jgi:hypothetical protein
VLSMLFVQKRKRLLWLGDSSPPLD